jgi:hypothetical protein
MMRRVRLKPVAWTARAGRGELTSWRSCCGWCGCLWEQSTKSELPCVDGFDGGGGMGSRPSGSLGARGVPAAPSSPEQWMALAGVGAEALTPTGGGDHPWLCK